jgi:5-methylcytosine-specific restriction endonuclease McrA
MWKACAKCGKIHEYNKKCYIGDTYRKKNTNANKFRATTQWKNKSEEVRIDSKYLCSVCLDNNIYTYDRLEVHHIEPIEHNYERRLDNYNLICLCNNHHRQAEEGKMDKEYLFKLAEKREEGYK